MYMMRPTLLVLNRIESGSHFTQNMTFHYIHFKLTELIAKQTNNQILIIHPSFCTVFQEFLNLNASRIHSKREKIQWSAELPHDCHCIRIGHLHVLTGTFIRWWTKYDSTKRFTWTQTFTKSLP